MMRNILIVFIIVLSSALLWLAFGWQPANETADRSSFVAATPKGGEFILQSHKGATKLSDFTDKVVVIYFGYTWCPDVCPTSLGYLTAALDAMTDQERQQVQGLFISVDPDRDSLNRLKDYAEYFHPNLLGITGTHEELAKVSKQYGSAYRKVEQTDSKMGYAVDHSADLYLVDRQGVFSEAIRHGTSPKDILESLRKLLN